MHPIGKITQDEFAQKIKEKYPDYKGMDNTQLVNKMIEKYPQYKEQLSDFAVEKKSQDGNGLEVDSKGNLQSSALGTSQSQGGNVSFRGIAPNKPQFTAENNFGFDNKEIAKGQQNIVENTADTHVKDFQGSVEERAHREERAAAKQAYKEKKLKDTPLALENAARKSLKIKGINPSNTAQLNQEKSKLALELETGNAEVGYKDGEPGLISHPRLWDSFHSHMMEDINNRKDAREFHTDDLSKKVEIAERLRQQKLSPYIDEKPTGLSSIGAMAGGVAPTLGLYGAGALAGGLIESVAPATGGLSNLALKPVMSFVTNEGDGANQKGMQGTLARYNEIISKNPEMDKTVAMKQATIGEDVDRAAGILETAAFASTGNVLGKSVSKNFIKGMVRSGVDVGAKTAVTEGLRDVGHNIEGVTHKDASEIGKDIANTFEENAPMGVLLHATMGAITGITKIPALFKSALKYDVVTKMNPDQVRAELAKNVKSGAITPEEANKAENDLNEFSKTLLKIPQHLSDESKASATGLIIKRDNILKQSEGLDKTAQDLTKEQTDAIDNQLKEIYRTDKPLEHEINPTTSETFKQPTFDDVAKQRVEELANKIASGKRIDAPEDLQTQANFHSELEKELHRISKEEKSANKNKENPKTELTDNVNAYLEKNVPQAKDLLKPHTDNPLFMGLTTDEQKIKTIAEQAQNVSPDGTKLEGNARQSTENVFGKPLVDAAIEKYPLESLVKEDKAEIGKSIDDLTKVKLTPEQRIKSLDFDDPVLGEQKDVLVTAKIKEMRTRHTVLEKLINCL